ncbi:GntR family transcriptional regulator [Clostridiales bacterium COT073_COT-073]|nr:GntR family transcriptional regulator [Clostridiales bacterium COT073_COT-073]
MNYHEIELMSKNGQIVVQLSRNFLSYQEGQRLPTISQFVEEYKVARGTVQSALRYLSESGAVTLQARGHLGTYVINIDYQRLWTISGHGAILGLMPLPYTKRYEGMATGLYQSFCQAKIPFNLAYMRGARHRLEMLEQGVYHFAIVSKLAVEDMMTHGKKFKIIHQFSEESYVTEHGIILRQGLKRLESGLKIALDESSPDQTLLTKKECQGIEVVYVPMSYNQILSCLETGEVDAAIWNLDELQEKNISVHLVPLQNKEARKFDRAGNRAVIAIDFANSYIGDIMAKLVDFSEIEKIQQLVVGHKKIPMY